MLKVMESDSGDEKLRLTFNLAGNGREFSAGGICVCIKLTAWRLLDGAIIGMRLMLIECDAFRPDR